MPGDRAHVLLLHGYTSTPYEVRPIGEALAAHGFAVRAPLLPGHGTTPEALNTLVAEDWVEASLRAYDALPASGPRFIVGASMGGLLALQVARRRKDVMGLVLLAPALLARPIGRVAMRLAPWGLVRLQRSIPKSDTGGDIASAEARAQNPCYPTLPVGGIAELERLRVQTWQQLPEISVPLCVLHGEGDRTIDPLASEVLASRVRSPWVERYLLPNSRHVLGLDVDRDEVCSIASRFITDLLDNEGEARRNPARRRREP